MGTLTGFWRVSGLVLRIRTQRLTPTCTYTAAIAQKTNLKDINFVIAKQVSLRPAQEPRSRVSTVRAPVDLVDSSLE